MPKNVKNTTFIGLLDLLAPHSCRGCGALGSVLCDRCKNNIIAHHQNLCPHCKEPNPTGKCPRCHNLPPSFIIGERSDLIGTLIHDFKYHSVRALARPLAEILDATLPNFSGEGVIVPLPTISRHIRERGLDHTCLIAKHFAKIRGTHCHTAKLLTRAHDTVQVGTDKTTRAAQAAHAYQLANIPINPSATYLLIDDVWTTGASMRAAINLLESAGAKNVAFTILALSRI